MLQQRAELLKEAETISLRKIVEYLTAVKGLPERLIDYGCAKCFGGQVSFQRQQQALDAVQDMIAGELEAAVRLTLNLVEAEKKLVSEELEKAKAAKEANWQNDPNSPKLWLKVFKALGIVILILFVIGLILSRFLPKE